MGGDRHDPAGVGPFQGAGAVGEALGQVDAVSPDPVREGRILADQQLQALGMGDGEQAPCADLSIWRAKRAVDDGAPAREPGGDGLRVRRPHRVSEEQQGRQGSPGPAWAGAKRFPLCPAAR